MGSVIRYWLYQPKISVLAIGSVTECISVMKCDEKIVRIYTERQKNLIILDRYPISDNRILARLAI